MEVRRIDPTETAAFDAWFAVLGVTDKERWPHLPGWQRSERLAWALDQDGPEEHQCLSATVDGRVVGIADLEMFRRENLHLARLDVRVLPEARRRGVGTALVAEAERIATAVGRRELGGMDESPVRPDYRLLAAPFAERLGFSPAMTMVRRQLRLPFAVESLCPGGDVHSLVPDGYSLLTFADRWPDEFIDDRCELGRRMSTDVPIGEQHLDEEEWDEARVRHVEASVAAQGRTKVTTAARHDGSGRLVAFTEIVIPKKAPESSWQHDTLVMREHRGHSLGLAVKVANAVAVTESFPAVRRISTFNAAVNDHMIAINDKMGFEVAAHSVYWLKQLARPHDA